MSNGLKLGLRQDLRIEQRIGVYLAPLMTPVLRRASASPPELDPASAAPADDEAPWRQPPRRRR